MTTNQTYIDRWKKVWELLNKIKDKDYDHDDFNITCTRSACLLSHIIRNKLFVEVSENISKLDSDEWTDSEDFGDWENFSEDFFGRDSFKMLFCFNAETPSNTVNDVKNNVKKFVMDSFGYDLTKQDESHSITITVTTGNSKRKLKFKSVEEAKNFYELNKGVLRLAKTITETKTIDME